jgi:hypothetical protein
MKIIEIGGALLLLLPVSHALAPASFYFLPLGGSAIAEIGIVLGVCAALKLFLNAIGGAHGDKD